MLPALVKLEAQPQQVQFKFNSSIRKRLGHKRRDRRGPQGRVGSAGLGELGTTGICRIQLGCCSLPSAFPEYCDTLPVPAACDANSAPLCLCREKRDDGSTEFRKGNCGLTVLSQKVDMQS